MRRGIRRLGRQGVCLMIGAAFASLTFTLVPQGVAHADAGTVDVQILGFNDFHGQLEQPTGNVAGAPAGGIEYFATAVKNYRAANPNTAVVSAGDMIGASPLLSGLFHDEPTIEAMRDLGVDYEGLGNHNFDEGVPELKRLQNGGCHPVDGCQGGHTFTGAGNGFRFLSANVKDATTHEYVFDPYGIKEFDGVKVGFIGVTLKGTPAIVSPKATAGYEFLDEADSVNALVPELQAQGVKTIIVLMHQSAGSGGSATNINGCSGSSNALVNRFDPEIDAVFSGHSHTIYNCTYNGRPVTQAGSQGKLITKLDMTIDKATGEPVVMHANNQAVVRTVTPDPNALNLMANYQAVATPIANEVQGRITQDLTKSGGGPGGDTALGSLIADSHLWGAQSEGAQIAFMNTGGIRTSLVYNQISGGEQPGEVTYGELFNVQPFGNNLETVTMTGDQIRRVLEQQFTGGTGILQLSDSLHYTQNSFKPNNQKIDPDQMYLNGVKMSMTATYRVTGNSFLIDGGDNYTVFAEGTDRTGGMVDNDATAAYFKLFSPIDTPTPNRIRKNTHDAPSLSTAPTITGTAKVGETLQATAGTWAVNGGTSVYSWQVDGVEVGTGTSYQVGPEALGKKITLVQTYTVNTYVDGVASVDSDVVAAGAAPQASAEVVINGVAQVGRILEAHGATWPVNGTSTFVWSVGGTQIATGEHYVVAPADLGKVITLTENRTSPGYDAATSTRDTDTVIPGAAPVALAGVTIEGNARVGSVLTAKGGTWPLQGSATFEWSIDGTVVGTGSTYTVAQADLGKVLKVTETFASEGYEPATSSAVTAEVAAAGAPEASTAVAITGDARVGQTLTAQAATWSVAGDSSFVWSIGGTQVGQGTTYVLSPDDLGKVITLTETHAADGYPPVTSTADSATVIAGLAPAASKAPFISGKAVVGKTLKVSGATWPLAGASAYRWTVGDKLVGSGTSYVVKKRDLGKKITVTEVFVAPGYAFGTSSAVSPKVAAAKVALRVTHGAAKKGKKVSLTVKVSSSNQKVPGKITVKYAGKDLGAKKIKNGKVVVKLPAKAKKGTYKVTITFPAANGFATASKTVKIKVV